MTLVASVAAAIAPVSGPDRVLLQLQGQEVYPTVEDLDVSALRTGNLLPVSVRRQLQRLRAPLVQRRLGRRKQAAQKVGQVVTGRLVERHRRRPHRRERLEHLVGSQLSSESRHCLSSGQNAQVTTLYTRGKTTSPPALTTGCSGNDHF